MLQTLLRVIYPPKCIFCRRIIMNDPYDFLCWDCYHKFKSELEVQRRVTGRELSAVLDQAEEKRDGSKETAVLGVFPLLPYENEYRRAILRWKYSGIRKYARSFARLIVSETHFFDLISIDALIPVPLAPSRKRHRGFNQAYDLAEAISSQTGIKVLDCLRRCRDTKPQASCSREERHANIAGSIQCVMPQEMMHTNINSIAVIDDIYTTGSTINECCKALRKSFHLKDIEIYVLVVGSGDY